MSISTNSFDDDPVGPGKQIKIQREYLESFTVWYFALFSSGVIEPLFTFRFNACGIRSSVQGTLICVPSHVSLSLRFTSFWIPSVSLGSKAFEMCFASNTTNSG